MRAIDTERLNIAAGGKNGECSASMTGSNSRGSRKSEGEIRKALGAEMLKAEPSWHVVEELSRLLVERDPDNVRFTVDAGHIQRLGAELVGKQETALSELIKNAYDADASKVTLRFSSHGAVGGTLVISDDGSGMSDETIRSAWMRISTASKIDAPVSPLYGRVRAGRKGIGRFSAQRLGQKLRLETRPRGGTTGYRVTFDWDADFQAGRDLTDVFSRIERFDKPAEDHGTKLSIFDLRDAWPESALAKVWRSVLLLQPPFPVAPVKASAPDALQRTGLSDPGFSVVINGKSREEQRTEYSIERTFLPQAIAKIVASIDLDGKATVTVTSPKLELSDHQDFDDKYLITGPVSLTAYYFIYTPEALSGMNAAAASEMGRNFGGIRIYRNGFRVLPYGEPLDDWLELDIDVARRNLLLPANNRAFFGHLEISGENNPLFEETSSREGLLENAAFHELRKFARNAVEWAVRRVGANRKKKLDAGQKGFVSETRKPSDFLQDIIEALTGSSTNTDNSEAQRKILSDAAAIAKAYEARVERQQADSLEYEEMLRLLASLGLSISVFGHEVKGSRDAMIARLALLGDAIEDAPENLKIRLEKQHTALTSAANRIFDIGGYIAGMMSRTESRELRSLSVKGSLTRFAEQFAEYMGKQGVEFSVDVEPPDLRTTLMHGSELDSVLLNFLTNSIKSMRQSRVDGRKVKLDGRRDGRHIVVGFEDNGGGVPAESREKIFDAFFTTTMAADDDGVAGPGNGLGLKIVSDIASSYGGTASLAEPSTGYNCRFEFRVLAAGDKA